MNTDMSVVAPSKVELRRIRMEEQRTDAMRVHEEMAAALVARDAKTIRLRALRLASEAAAQAVAAALPPKPKTRRRKVVAR